MLRLSKKIEYALLSLQFIASRNEVLCSAKVIAERHGISYELTAKVLSALSKAGIIQSVQGANGGFVLAKSAASISLTSVIVAVEGKKAHIVECQGDDQDRCSAEDSCTIRFPLKKLQEKIEDCFDSMTVADLVGENVELIQLQM